MTDFTDLPCFVYPIDKFNNFEALEREILKKISEITLKKGKKEAKMTILRSELDKRVARDA